MSHTEYRRIVTDNDYTDVTGGYVGIHLAVSTANGDITTLTFDTPEAFSRFMLSLAESPTVHETLAQAGAGFSLTVEPLPQPVDA